MNILKASRTFLCGTGSSAPMANWNTLERDQQDPTPKIRWRGTKFMTTIWTNMVSVKIYERMLKTMHKKAIAELDYCITGERFNLTQAEVQESVLAGMLKNAGSGRTIEQTLIHLSKWIGQWIKPKEISAKEYFTLLKELENYNKINKPTDG